MHKNMIHLFCQFNQVFRNSTLYFKYFSKVEMTGAFLLPSQLGDNPCGKETWFSTAIPPRLGEDFPRSDVLPHQKLWLWCTLFRFLLSPYPHVDASHGATSLAHLRLAE